MEKRINRVLLAFRTWEDRKKEIDPLLKAGAADVLVLSRLQLDHLRQVRHRLRQTVRPDESPFLILLNNQIAKLEKQLHPNLLRRIFSQLQNRLFEGPAYLKQQQRIRDHNMESLKIQLKDAGLGSFAGRLEHHLDPELKNVRLPLDCQLGSEKRLNLNLHFEKDPYSNFQLNRIGGNLLLNNKVAKSQEFELDDCPNLKTNQIWSLLEGRAMKQQYTDASGHENHRWVELGSNGIQRYDPTYAFDIKMALATMPAITGNKEELIRYLENGQQLSTYWKQGQQYQSINIRADPANKRIRLLDDKLRPVTAEKLNQNLARQNTKVKTLGEPLKKNRKMVRNGQHQ
jgi:hypothetical protein